MNEPTLTLAELRQSELRVALGAVDDQLRALTPEDTTEASSRHLAALNASWRHVVALLAIEPEPERRKCPTCRGPMRREATRCVHCWSKSIAPA